MLTPVSAGPLNSSLQTSDHAAGVSVGVAVGVAVGVRVGVGVGDAAGARLNPMTSRSESSEFPGLIDTPGVRAQS